MRRTPSVYNFFVCKLLFLIIENLYDKTTTPTFNLALHIQLITSLSLSNISLPNSFSMHSVSLPYLVSSATWAALTHILCSEHSCNHAQMVSSEQTANTNMKQAPWLLTHL